MMSMADGEEMSEADTLCCASCGIAENDDVKLVQCDGCDLVRYCGVNCQRDHKSRHLLACKQRAAELRDELLFRQPDSSHLGDCPICMIPLSIDHSKSTMNGCCSKVICDGCRYANHKREEEMRLQPSCPFCRVPLPRTDEEIDRQRTKRVQANDPVALCHEGAEQYNKGERDSAFQYWTKAAELGNAWAHFKLAAMYDYESGVVKDVGNEMRHLEEAAISGHPDARYALGAHEYNNGNNERAVKHWIIAAAQGDNESIEMLMDGFKKGFVEKEVLAAALRAQKAAVDATKNVQREVGEEFYRNMDNS